MASGADLALFTDNEPANKFGRLSNKPSIAQIDKEEKLNPNQRIVPSMLSNFFDSCALSVEEVEGVQRRMTFVGSQD